MSRVDEARKRAAEIAGTVATDDPLGTVLLTPLPPFDGAVVAADAFLLERPDRPLPRAAAIPVQTPAPLDPPVAVAPAVINTPPTAPFDLGADASHKLVSENMMPASREQYRLLAATLHKAQAANGTKVVMIASAVMGEGKTLTAANLALTFSESYQRRVLLIDADLRHPALHVLFGVDNSVGLSDGLTSPEQRAFPVRQLSPRLAILTTGRVSADPMAELTSEGMKYLVQHAREAYDWVVIDTPPIGLLPDAGLVAAMADAAVMVLRAESTPYDLVARAADAVGRQKIVGVVLNRARRPQSGDYKYAKDYGGAAGAAQGRR